MKQNLSSQRNLSKALVYAALIAGSITMIFPFAWMLLTSFKTQAESMAIPPQIFPAQWNFDNFVKALQSLPFWNLYINTFLLIFFRVICAVVFSSMAGYAFAKLEFPCKNLLFGLVLMQMMLPSQIFIIPQYQMLAKMGLTNTIFALVFPGLVSAFGTFFLRQAYSQRNCRGSLSGWLHQMADLYQGAAAPDQIQHRRAGDFHSGLCLRRPDVAPDL